MLSNIGKQKLPATPRQKILASKERSSLLQVLPKTFLTLKKIVQ
jgi:hypothetical protein